MYSYNFIPFIYRLKKKLQKKYFKKSIYFGDTETKLKQIHQYTYTSQHGFTKQRQDFC